MMILALFVAALCIALLGALIAWEAEREKRADAEKEAARLRSVVETYELSTGVLRSTLHLNPFTPETEV